MFEELYQFASEILKLSIHMEQVQICVFSKEWTRLHHFVSYEYLRIMIWHGLNFENNLENLETFENLENGVF